MLIASGPKSPFAQEAASLGWVGPTEPHPSPDLLVRNLASQFYLTLSFHDGVSCSSSAWGSDYLSASPILSSAFMQPSGACLQGNSCTERSPFPLMELESLSGPGAKNLGLHGLRRMQLLFSVVIAHEHKS